MKLSHALVYCCNLFQITPTVGRDTLFTLVSTARDTDPPVFTLSFNVTGLPPSTVNCTVDGVMTDIADEDIDRYVVAAQYPNTSVLVTVTVRSRQTGSYQCSVVGIAGNGINANATEAVKIIGTLGFIGIATSIICITFI